MLVILDFIVKVASNQESTTSSLEEFLIWHIHALQQAASMQMNELGNYFKSNAE